MAAEDNDLLALRDNEDVAKMLKKHGKTVYRVVHARRSLECELIVVDANERDKDARLCSTGHARVFFYLLFLLAFLAFLRSLEASR